MEISHFDRWVVKKQPPARSDWGPGFWNYIEFIRRISEKFEACNHRVVGEYVVNTPPPEQEMLMPAVAFDVGKSSFALKEDFAVAGFRPPWFLSARLDKPYCGSTFGLFDVSLDAKKQPTPGFGIEWSFPSHAESPSSFTCLLEDELDIAAALRILIL